MPSVSATLRRSGGVSGVWVDGFEQLYRALRRIEGGISPELRSRLRAIGQIVREQASDNAPRQSGALAGSIKVSVTQKGASVYSTSEYGGTQNVGGWVKGRGPHVSRANASRYMSRAVDETRGEVKDEMDELVKWLLREFVKG